MSAKGTYCVYDDGEKRYHDLLEEEYVVISKQADAGNMFKTKKQKTKASFEEEAVRHEIKCPICLDYLTEPMTLQGCSHTYCKTCLSSHLALTKNCPLCLVHVASKRDAWHNLPLEKIINIYRNDDQAKQTKEAALGLLGMQESKVSQQSRMYKCSKCMGWKSASAQKCSNPCFD